MREEITEPTGESKEGIIEAVLPQRTPFDKEEDLVYTYVRSLPKQAYIYSFWDATGPEEKINWQPKR